MPATIASIGSYAFSNCTALKTITIPSGVKTIGSYAREDLEKFFGVKIYLDLWVRVKENWRDKPSAVYDFGYKPEDHE